MWVRLGGEKETYASLRTLFDDRWCLRIGLGGCSGAFAETCSGQFTGAVWAEVWELKDALWGLRILGCEG